VFFCLQNLPNRLCLIAQRRGCIKGRSDWLLLNIKKQKRCAFLCLHLPSFSQFEFRSDKWPRAGIKGSSGRTPHHTPPHSASTRLPCRPFLPTMSPSVTSCHSYQCLQIPFLPWIPRRGWLGGDPLRPFLPLAHTPARTAQTGAAAAAAGAAWAAGAALSLRRGVRKVARTCMIKLLYRMAPTKPLTAAVIAAGAVAARAVAPTLACVPAGAYFEAPMKWVGIGVACTLSS